MTDRHSEGRAQALEVFTRTAAAVPRTGSRSPFAGLEDRARRDRADRLDDVLEQVRDAADIVGLIGAHVELKRTGTDYRGPCPFHGGTHRNFAVIPKKQMFYCFVCHEAGDVFAFFMKKFGMDFPTAVREVAGKVGITIPDRSTHGPDLREPLFEALSVAAEWFARRLREATDAAAARAYVERRGFVLNELLPLGLGWAPKGDDFRTAMHQLGLTDQRLLDAGLLTPREDGSLRPCFRRRLLFPIHDLRGRVVGFGGRVLGDGEPRYLNSPDSAVFHKGDLLYNLHQAKQPIRQAESAVLVEGYLDALRLVLAGVDHVVAPLGTSLTAEQAALLKRVTAHVTVLFDGDKRGVRATFRTAKALLQVGVTVSVATMPAGEDPDSLVRTAGVGAVEQVLRGAVDVLERQLGVLGERGWLGTLTGRRRALDRLLPTLRAASDPVTRDLYVSRTAEALGISREAVMAKVAPQDRCSLRPTSAGPAVAELTDPDEAARAAMREGA